MSASSSCPFCTLPIERIALRNASGVLVRDAYPVSQGHSLVIPHRHIGSFFDLTDNERADLMRLLEQVKQQLDGLYQPDGYNIGINDGPAAGQTVPHLHIHLIPRYKEDVSDPRGGVRWVLPEKAAYWSA